MAEEKLVEPAGEAQEDIQAAGDKVFTRIGRILFRLLVAVVVGLALGAGLYYGAVRLYREAIEPIQQYEQRISDLERSLGQITQTLESDSQELNQRQTILEGRLAEQTEALASARALLDGVQQDVREQRRMLGGVAELEDEIENITLALGELSDLVAGLEAAIAAGDLPAQRVQRTAVYLRAMSLLTRAELELEQNNQGFAAEQVEAAKQTLSELVEGDAQVEDPSHDQALIVTIVERLDGILSDLPGRPEVAANDLEAVWQLFMEAVQPLQLEDIETGGE
jgi:type II secretory pathway component PulJ